MLLPFVCCCVNCAFCVSCCDLFSKRLTRPPSGNLVYGLQHALRFAVVVVIGFRCGGQHSVANDVCISLFFHLSVLVVMSPLQGHRTETVFDGLCASAFL